MVRVGVGVLVGVGVGVKVGPPGVMVGVGVAAPEVGVGVGAAAWIIWTSTSNVSPTFFVRVAGVRAKLTVPKAALGRISWRFLTKISSKGRMRSKNKRMAMVRYCFFTIRKR